MRSASNHAVTSDLVVLFPFFSSSSSSSSPSSSSSHYDYSLALLCQLYFWECSLFLVCLLAGTITYTNIHDQDMRTYRERGRGKEKKEKEKGDTACISYIGKSRIILIMHQFLLLFLLLLLLFLFLPSFSRALSLSQFECRLIYDYLLTTTTTYRVRQQPVLLQLNFRIFIKEKIVIMGRHLSNKVRCTFVSTNQIRKIFFHLKFIWDKLSCLS